MTLGVINASDIPIRRAAADQALLLKALQDHLTIGKALHQQVLEVLTLSGVVAILTNRFISRTSAPVFGAGLEGFLDRVGLIMSPA